MKKINKLIILSFLFLTILFLVSCKTLTSFSKTYTFFDTIIYLDIYDTSLKEANNSFDYAKNTLRTYNALLDRYNEQSEDIRGIKYINDHPNEKIVISDELYDIIKYSIDEINSIEDETAKNNFSISIGKVSDIWHEVFDKYSNNPTFTDDEIILPTAEELSIDMDLDQNHIELFLEDKSIRIPENMSLDLGGLAKGYVSEIITDYYDKNDIKYVLNMGSSNIKTNIGNPKRENSKYIVALTNPKEVLKHYGQVILPLNTSIVTSGDYQRYFVKNNRIYSHILDPETFEACVTDVRSVSIITEDGAYGDILSTISFIMGIKKSYEYIESLDNVEAIFYSTSDKVYVTSGIGEIFKIDEDYVISAIADIEIEEGAS